MSKKAIENQINKIVKEAKKVSLSLGLIDTTAKNAVLKKKCDKPFLCCYLYSRFVM